MSDDNSPLSQPKSASGNSAAPRSSFQPPSESKVKTGRYRHYKGNEYTVIGTVRHSETLEELVLYRQEYSDRGLWVRPLEMFLETVTVDGRDLPRFQSLAIERTIANEKGDLLSKIPQNLPQELFETILTKPNLHIERIVSHGHSSPAGFWYDQNQHEFVVLLQGAARLRFEDGEIEMHAGSFIDIPPHRRHRVEWTTTDEPTIWLSVHHS